MKPADTAKTARYGPSPYRAVIHIATAPRSSIDVS